MLYLIPVLVSCNSANDKDEAKTDSPAIVSTSSATTQQVNYPYSVSYSAQFEKGDDKNAQMVLGLWKEYDNNSFQNVADKFADTVTMLFPGFEMLHVSRDSAIASTKAYRNTFNTVASKVSAVTALKSTDKNENWVLVWGTESHTDKKNVTDSVELHEAWRINKDGRVDYMEQFIRNFPPPSKK